jgi:hypothetical protein
VNQTIESEIVAKIESDSRSFNYTFPTFQDQYNLRIHYWAGKRIKRQCLFENRMPTGF